MRIQWESAVCTKCLYSIRPLRQRNPSPHPSCAKRQDDRWLCKFMRRISPFAEAKISPLFYSEKKPQNGNGKTDITVDLFQTLSHEARSGFPKTCPCNLQRNADFKCFLRRNNLAGSFPYPTADAQPHTAVRIQRRCQPPGIKIERCSKLKQFVGSCIYVNSFHHQSVKTPGRNVCVSARSPDGVIEAIELSGHPFALGVQWHPECMYRTSPEMRSLFHEFIAHSLINSKDSGHTISWNIIYKGGYIHDRNINPWSSKPSSSYQRIFHYPL